MSKQQIEDNGWMKPEDRSQVEEMKVDEEEPQLLVTMPEGRTLTLYIGLQHTVMDAKIKIQDKSGVPQSIQRILFGGHQLADGNRLLDYGLRRGDRLQVMYLLRGGMQQGAHILPLIVSREGEIRGMRKCQSRIPPQLDQLDQLDHSFYQLQVRPCPVKVLFLICV